MQEQLLTARVVYRFLNIGVGTPLAPIPLLNNRFHTTQTGFWWCFLSAGIPESSITPYFYTGNGRPRALSNLMNRTVPHSMPRKLYHTMEESLNEENILYMTVWLSTVIDENVHPRMLHSAITNLEKRIYEGGSDTEFASLYDFFTSFRPLEDVLDTCDVKKLVLLALLRISLLGIHAIYGDMMTESPALRQLRACRLNDPDTLWETVLTVVPRLKDGVFSFIRAAEMRRRDAETARMEPLPDDAALLDGVAALARGTLPPKETRQEHEGPNAGWYVVANWMDFCVNVNDSPRATYDSARELDTMPNGTLVYVLSAPGYQGLHVSPGVWGKIVWRGEIAWIPMNLLIRLNSEESAPKEARE